MIVPAVPGWMLDILNVSAVTVGTLFLQSTLIIIAGISVAFIVSSGNVLYRNLIYRGMLVSILLCPLVSFAFLSAGFDLVAVDIVRHESARQDDIVVPAAEIPTPVLNGHTAVSIPDNAGINNGGFRSFTAEFRRKASRSVSFVTSHLHIIPWIGGIFSRPSLTIIILTVTLLWLVMLIINFFRFIFLLFKIDRIVARSGNPSRETILRVKAAARKIEIDTPLVCESDAVESPFVTGLFKQILMIPRGLYPTEEMLIHELAHLRRRDCLWNYLSNIAEIIYPVQPLLRLLNRWIETTNDFICDDYVIEFGGEAKAYAGQLFSLAQYFNAMRGTRIVGAGFIMIKSRLRARIERIVGPTGKRILKNKAPLVATASTVFLLITMLTGTLYFPPVQDFLILAAKDTTAAKTAGEKIYNIELVMQKSRTAKQAPADPVREIEEAPADDHYHPIIQKTAPENVSAVVPEIAPEQISTEDVNSGELSGQINRNRLENIIPDEFSIGIVVEPDEEKQDNPTLTAIQIDHETVESVPEIQNSSEYSHIDKFLQMDPDTIRDIESSMEIGRTLYSRGYYVKAEEYFYRAMEFNPDDPEVRNALGLVYRAKRDTELAILYFKLAVTLKPDFAEAYRNLGDTVLSSGDATGAWQYYRIAINLNPAFAAKKSSPRSSL